MRPKIKICGIRTLAAAQAAINDSADFLGFIHFAKSPRHLSVDDMAALMKVIRETGAQLPLVAVVVDPDDTLLDALRDTVRPDFIQLHGKETPARVAEIAALTGLPLIKVLSVGEAADLYAAEAYEPHVTYLMFDAKPPKDAALPGGLGLRFDWTLMQGYRGTTPWFLAGGLDAANAREAVELSGATLLDVSSGVESAPGQKDAGLISGFLRTAKAI
ncbi:phosphoribosylanthranilate isomerase [Asticcacaulis sp. 201]|uniref:phosphoribosylanthranilate isomerase n=1 Tax=Asticcacaulis sp. 201 TaxID=3028787 RepID=UPI00291688F1|nr:phosphoribosylanthranilate isomerase [Asticcacaulis sp. 201]MDV6331394.1 phosphoribosylanthranilate isomerase [Asticcacaulis sp. 201]